MGVHINIWTELKNKCSACRTHLLFEASVVATRVILWEIIRRLDSSRQVPSTERANQGLEYRLLIWSLGRRGGLTSMQSQECSVLHRLQGLPVTIYQHAPSQANWVVEDTFFGLFLEWPRTNLYLNCSNRCDLYRHQPSALLTVWEWNKDVLTAAALLTVAALTSESPIWSNNPSETSCLIFFIISSMAILSSTRADSKRSSFFVPRRAEVIWLTLRRRFSMLWEKWDQYELSPWNDATVM